MSGYTTIAAAVLRMDEEARKIKMDTGGGDMKSVSTATAADKKRFNDDPRRGAVRVHFMEEW